MGKFSLKDEIQALADVVSGERSLRANEEKEKEMKENAKEEQRIERKRRVVKGEDILPKVDDVEEKKIVQNIKVFEWESPERVKIRFEKKSFLILLGAVLLLILYLAVLGHYALMLSIMSVVFLIYVWGTTEPDIVKHKITARGVDLETKLYEWYMLESFYFTKKDNQLFLFIDTKLKYPPSLTFLLNEEDKDSLFVVLQDKLLYKDIRKQPRLSKFAYGEYIPLEKV